MHDDAVGETDTTFIQFVFSEKLRSGQQQFILKKSTEGTNLPTKPTTPYSEIQVSKRLNLFLFFGNTKSSQVQLKVDGEWLIEDDDMTEVSFSLVVRLKA